MIIKRIQYVAPTLENITLLYIICYIFWKSLWNDNNIFHTKCLMIFKDLRVVKDINNEIMQWSFIKIL